MGIAPWAQAAVVGGTPPAQLPLTIDGLPYDNFGAAVAIDGDTAVVTSPYATANGVEGAGSAFVFVRDGAGWLLQAQLAAQDPKPFSNYGRAVAIEGDTLVVGAYSADGVDSSTGAAYVFTRSGSVWTQQAKLSANDGEGFSDFGYAVALSGDSVVVGAPSTFINGENIVGAAYAYLRVGNAWSQQQKLTASDGLGFDSFGTSVAVQGDTAAIGAKQATVAGQSFSGAAYVFARSGGSWTELQKLSAADASVEASFGHSIALSNNSLIVGAPQPQLLFGGGAGAAYVFAISEGSWIQQAKLEASDGVIGDAFGSAVGLDGDSAVVGSPLAGSVAGVDLEAGAVYAYQRSGESWAQQARIVAVGGQQGSQLGMAVGLSGNIAVAGAANARVGSNDAQGKGYLFTLGTAVPAVTPGALDFGDVATGATASRTLVLRNVGTADLFSGALVLIGDDAAQFAVLSDGCSGQRLAPAGSCQGVIGFSPAAVDTYSAQVVAPGSAGVAFLPLSGQGVVPPPQIAVNPNPVTQSLLENQTFTQPITLSHPGSSQTLQWALSEDSRAVRSRLQVLGEATEVSTVPAVRTAGSADFVRSRVAPGSAPARPAGLPPVGQTLSQSSSETITAGNAISCGNNETGTTNANQFLRAFTLSDFGIDSAFEVSSIRFGIEALSVEVPVTINLYTLDGSLSYFNLQRVATTITVQPAQALTLVDVPITASIPAGATLVLEVEIPDLGGVNGNFVPGSNAAGQSAPSFIAAARCNAAEPRDLAEIGFPDMHLVMSVTGQSAAPPADCALPDWLDLATRTGTLAPGGSQGLSLLFDSAGLAVGTHRANLCFASNADDALYPVPVTLSVTAPLPPAIFADGFE
jgi:hypothetical protein